jgi:SAM-dependent methyltransferase
MSLLDRLSAKLRTVSETVATLEAKPMPPASAATDQPDPPPVWELLDSPSGSHLYFLNPDHVQEGLLDLLAHEPRRVLDIGCYCGATGELVKKRWPAAHVVGVEPLAEAAALAAPRIDRVINSTLENVDFEHAGIAEKSIDAIILADVLEHIYNPWRALQRLRPLLSDDGVILASIPNVRNLGLIYNLISGNWTYQGGGLLDITHIRFFTLNEMRRMFEETGFTIEHIARNFDPALEQLARLDAGQKTANIQLGPMLLQNMPIRDIHELATLQFYLRASPSA